MYLNQLEEDMREVMGQSKMGRAQRINVETAHEVERVQQGQDIATGRVEDAYRDFLRDNVQTYMKARRETMQITGPELVRLIGQRDADGVQEWAEVAPDQLRGDFEFEIEVGSTRPRDRAAEAQQAGAMLTVALQNPAMFNVAYYARRLVESAGDPIDDALNKEALVAAKVKMVDEIRRDAGLGGEAAAQNGGGIDPNALASIGGNGGGLTQ